MPCLFFLHCTPLMFQKEHLHQYTFLCVINVTNLTLFLFTFHFVLLCNPQPSIKLNTRQNEKLKIKQNIAEEVEDWLQMAPCTMCVAVTTFAKHVLRYSAHTAQIISTTTPMPVFFQYAFEISLQTSGDSLHCECLLRLVFRLFHKLYVITLI